MALFHNQVEALPMSSTADDSVQKETLLVAGLEVYAYYSKAKSNPFDPKSIGDDESLKVMFSLHGRNGSAQESDGLYRDLVARYYKESSGQSLVIITFDHRNHGKRTVNKDRNKTWKEGNDSHGADMLSIIAGGVADVKTIYDYLPALIPGLSKYKKVTHVMSGISMGAMTTLRVAVQHPGIFSGAVSLIGSFDLTSSLMNRLHDFGRSALYKESYDSLSKSFEPRLYPRELFDVVAKDDTYCANNYDLDDKLKTFLMFGDHDNIIPSSRSEPFLTKHGKKFKSRKDFDSKEQFQAIKYNAGHEVTTEMREDWTNWLVKF